VGVIKDTHLPLGSKIDEDAVLDLQTKHFHNHPLYIDAHRAFYQAMGNVSFFSDTPLTTWNPFKLASDFGGLSKMMKTKAIAASNAGLSAKDGAIKGGVLILHKVKGVVFSFSEKSSLNHGHTIPLEEIKAAIDGALGAVAPAVKPDEEGDKKSGST